MTKLTTLALAIMAASVLQAGDVKFGLKATLAMPQGEIGDKDHLDGQMGYGIGADVLIPMSGGHAIVPRFDYTTIKKSENGGDITVTPIGIGADYNYYFSGNAGEGFYLGLGLGYTSAKIEFSSGPHSLSSTPTALYTAASLGYMFTANIGAELRYTSTSLEPEFFGYKEKVSSPILNASFVVRF
jgi:hypothetical protein